MSEDLVRQASSCPVCGAPIYVDTEFTAMHPSRIPNNIFTCDCRKPIIVSSESLTVPENTTNKMVIEIKGCVGTDRIRVLDKISKLFEERGLY